MILDIVKDYLSGDKWEELIIACCRSTYKEYDFMEVPAGHKGDCGIEGFTQNGIVIQCYCPDDRNLSKDDLYNHQRDKVTKDINKLIANKDRLAEIGVSFIDKWIFIVPEYKDKRILQHLCDKEKLVSETKKNDPSSYTYISDNFKCLIKVADDFINEIVDLFNSTALGKKLDLPLLTSYNANWRDIESEKVDNVKRKTLAINPMLINNDSLWDKLINNYMTLYAQGLEFMDDIGTNFPELRANILELKNLYKFEVETKSMMNPDSTLNNKIFIELQKEFTKQLETNFSGLSPNTIMSLTHSTTAEWLADCPLEFIGDLNE
ncbi:hypothetical protein [Lysinibacillus sphaericus]|uniref:hypothetical protein n=1 Tax=Lysinibacillus sphaericus TaxID=1421 RepID=UPI003D71456F